MQVIPFDHVEPKTLPGRLPESRYLGVYEGPLQQKRQILYSHVIFVHVPFAHPGIKLWQKAFGYCKFVRSRIHHWAFGAGFVVVIISSLFPVYNNRLVCHGYRVY